MTELVARLTFDEQSVQRTSRKIQQASEKGGNNTRGGAGAVAGGVALGSLLGGLLAQLDSISGLLKLIAGLINAFVAPFVPLIITLLRPFLILFLAAGALLLKWLQGLLSGNDSNSTQQRGGAVAGGISGAIAGFALAGPVGAIIGAIVGAIAGAKIVEGFQNVFGKLRDKLIETSDGIDREFGTDTSGILSNSFDALSNIFTLWSQIITLQWGKIPETIKAIGANMIGIIEGWQQTFTVLGNQAIILIDDLRIKVIEGIVDFANGFINFVNGLIDIANRFRSLVGLGNISSLDTIDVPDRFRASQLTPNDLFTPLPTNDAVKQIINVTVNGDPRDKQVFEEIVKRARLETLAGR